MHLINILDYAHAEILGLSGLLSEEDMRDIHNLDKEENDLLAMVDAIDARATGIKTEAVQAGIDIYCFKMPPPPGVSKQLHDWMDDVEVYMSRKVKFERLERIKDSFIAVQKLGLAPAAEANEGFPPAAPPAAGAAGSSPAEMTPDRAADHAGMTPDQFAAPPADDAAHSSLIPPAAASAVPGEQDLRRRVNISNYEARATPVPATEIHL